MTNTRDTKIKLYAFLLRKGRISERSIPDEYRDEAVALRESDELNGGSQA